MKLFYPATSQSIAGNEKSGTFKQPVFMRMLFVLLLFITGAANAQIAVSGGTSLAATYTSLTNAGGLFAAINATAQTGNNIVVTITADVTTEAGTNGLNNGAWTTISITPSGARTISGNVASAPLINFNGADKVTINGLNTGGNSLTISNTNTGSTAATSTVRFIADASNNTITNTTIAGSSTSALATIAGTILFSTGTSTGNDANTISSCNIGPAGANLPSKAIMGSGSSSSIENDNALISGNNIFDFFLATGSVSGINILTGNEGWTISGNKFYQTTARTFSAAALRYAAITMNNTTAVCTISGNTIGFANSGSTGTTTILGSSNQFRGIDIEATRTTTPFTSIQGNTISGIVQTTSSNNTTTSDNGFIAIQTGTSAVDAPANVGNVTGNTIGSLDGSSGIVVNATSTTASTVPVVGILDFNFIDGIIISNNSMGTITINSGGSGTTVGFRGILINTTSAISVTVNNNIIGGTAAGSITDNIVGVYSMFGIQNTGSTNSAGITATGNTIRNISANSTAPSTIVIAGIIVGPVSSTVNTISQNTVHSFFNASGAVLTAIYGLSLTMPSLANIVERNYVHSFSSTSSVASCQLWGISGGASGTTTYKNNMVRLGIDAAGNSVTYPASIIGIRESAGAVNNYYNNSVYIGGSGVLATPTPANTYAFQTTAITGTRSFIDNIFYNARGNAVGGGTAHLAIGFSTSTTGITSNYNDLFVSGTDGNTGVFNGTIYPTLANFRTATGKEANSIAANPFYIAPAANAAGVDLHIDPVAATPVEGTGLLVASVTNDFDGQTRSGLTPTDIGADAGTFCIAPAITGQPLATQTRCAAVAASQLSVAASGTGITYQWFSNTAASTTVPTPVSVGTGSTYTPSTASAGTLYYYAVATGTCGTATSGFAQVIVNALPTVSAVTGGAAYCTGNTPANVVANVTGTGPWSVSYTLNGTPQSPATGGLSPISLGNAAGAYVVTGISDANCSGPASGTQTISINPLPTVSSVTGGATYCAGQTPAAIHAAVTGTGPWSVSYTLNGTPQPAATGSSSPISLGNAAGAYIVTGISDANCSGPASGTQTIAFNPLPTVTALTGGATYCAGQTATAIHAAVTGTGPWSVAYTLNGTPQPAATGSSSPISLGNAAGAYVVTGISDANCSGPAGGTQTIAFNPLPTVSSVTGGATYCTGQTPANINAAVTGTGPWSVAYTLNGTPQPAATGSSSPISLGNAAGAYVVTGISDANCSGPASGSQTISFNPNSTITLTSGAGSNNQASCFNTPTPINNITYSVAGAATGAGVTGLPPGITGVYNAGVFTISGTATAAGTYNYTVTTTGGGCAQATATGTIIVNAPPTATYTKNDVSVCGGANDGSISVIAAGGTGSYTYSWTGITGSGNPANTPYPNPGNVSTITNLPIGYYNVTITDAVGCPVTITGIHILNAFSVYITNSGSNTSTCGNIGTIILYGNAGVTPYTYSLDGGAYGAGNTFTGLAAGSHTAYVKDAKGCVSIKSITVNAAAAIVVSPFVRNASSCSPDGSIEVYRSGGIPPYTYSKDGITYGTGNVFTALAAGSYTVYVKDAAGCIGSAPATVAAGAGLSATIGKVNTSSCIADGSIQVNPTGGTGPYTYSKDNGTTYQPGNSFSPLAAGNYAIKVKDSKGCTSGTINVTINVNTINVTSFVTNASSCASSNGSVQLFRTGGTGPYTYSLDGNTYQSTPTFTGKAAGTYDGYVKDSKGCIGVQSGIVVGPSCPRPVVTKGTSNTNTKVFATNLKVQAYPNPTASSFTLKLEGYSDAKVNIVVTDIMGRVVYQSTGNANKSYSFGSSFKAGVYHVQVMQGEEKQTVKLVKE